MLSSRLSPYEPNHFQFSINLDVSIIATSSKFSESDFEDLGIPFVQIKTNGNFSDAAKDFLEGLMASKFLPTKSYKVTMPHSKRQQIFYLCE